MSDASHSSSDQLPSAGRGRVERAPGFTYKSSAGKTGAAVMRCEQVPLPKLAERFGTPLYVYSSAMIRERVRAFQKAFRGVEHSICYSVKANSNLSILRMLGKMGCGFDVVSGGELERVLRVDRRAAKRVVFSGVGQDGGGD